MVTYLIFTKVSITLLEKYSLKVEGQTTEETKNKNLFVIVRSLKHEDGTQKVQIFYLAHINLYL